MCQQLMWQCRHPRIVRDHGYIRQCRAPVQDGQVLGLYNYSEDSGLVVHTKVSLRLLDTMDEIDFGDGVYKDRYHHNYHHHNYGCAVARCANVDSATEVQEERTQQSWYQGGLQDNNNDGMIRISIGFKEYVLLTALDHEYIIIPVEF